MNTQTPENPTQPLEAAIADVIARRDELVALNQFVETNARRQAQLEIEADLADKKALGEIALCQTVTELSERRINARTDAVTSAEKTCLAQCHLFISNAASPKRSALQRRIEEKVRNDLRHHFSDSGDVEQAVTKCIQVQEMETLSWYLTIKSTHTPGGLLSYARQLLETWEKLKGIEAQLK